MNRAGVLAVMAFGLAIWQGAIAAAWAASPSAGPQARPPGTTHRAEPPKATSTNESPAKAKAASGTNDSKEAGPSPFSAFTMGSGRGPINISSDSLSLDYKGKTVLFSGHVNAVQANGGQQLTCNRLKVVYGKDFNDLKEMIADGNVRMSQGTRWVTGDHAVMNQARQTVILTGSPVVHDGTDQITGSKITVHLDTGKSVVENARAVIFPKQTQTTDNVMAGGGAQ
jgi:lipopolysaccharide export system protein LptA